VLEHLVLDMVVVIVGHGWFLSWALVCLLCLFLGVE
jgi:hypothetical protein